MWIAGSRFVPRRRATSASREIFLSMILRRAERGQVRATPPRGFDLAPANQRGSISSRRTAVASNAYHLPLKKGSGSCSTGAVEGSRDPLARPRSASVWDLSMSSWRVSGADPAHWKIEQWKSEGGSDRDETVTAESREKLPCAPKLGLRILSISGSGENRRGNYGVLNQLLNQSRSYLEIRALH